MKRTLIIGGAGFKGSVLVPILLEQGYKLTVLDTFWFWKDPKDFVGSIWNGDLPSDSLRLVQGDMRDCEVVSEALKDVNKVILLACLSNDPCAELDKQLTFDINFNGSKNVIDCCNAAGVERLIYASSSSVYGVQPNSLKVTEKIKPNPITQYSELKVKIEEYIKKEMNNFVIVRPSTMMGVSPRMRIDLVANILTYHAVKNRKIKVFGGEQLRPLIHVRDMASFYELLLRIPLDKINRKVYNVGYGNLSVKQIAGVVKDVIGPDDVVIETVESSDDRSYHVCSDKAKEELGFIPRLDLKTAIIEMKKYFEQNKDFEDPKYYNIRTIKKVIGK